MNAIPKYVVSKTLRVAAWENTTFLRGDVVEEVAALKERIDGEIVVLGSGDLVDALIQHDLVDEFRIIVYPVVLGSGRRLFREGRDTSDLRMIGTRAFSSGTVLLTYEPPAGRVERVRGDLRLDREQIRSWQAAQDTDRVLASVLFTDIVDSTGRAAALGDRHGAGSSIVTTRSHERRSSATAAPRQDHGRRHPCHVRRADPGAPVRVRLTAWPVTSGSRSARDPHRRDRGPRSDVGGIGVHIAARVLAEAGSRSS